MLRGSGPALAAAAVAREELSLPCHRVPAEEGEGRDAAFPVPPAWLDLRGLRLPGNSKAAAGPGSARGLLVGAGPDLFGTPSRGKRLRGGQAGALGAPSAGWWAWPARGSGRPSPAAGAELDPGAVRSATAAASSPSRPLCSPPRALTKLGLLAPELQLRSPCP